MQKVMITGASGQLGLALYRLLQDDSAYELLRTNALASEDKQVQALDITEELAVKEYIQVHKPDIIINCAAMTSVDLCETEEETAYRINALGPKYLAMEAEQIGAKLVHVSTDYVYDGLGNEPYTEESSPNPLSVYGKTKLAGDEYVQAICERHFILRTAWVYGEGKNFVKTMLRLAESNNKIRVVEDQYGTPTSALELARVIIFLMNTKSYGIYHATAEGSASWYEFAKTIFEETGKTVDLEAISTSEYKVAAKRPMYSVLDNKALRERHGYVMMEWKLAFKEYVKEL
jgi:dTDP-4-dehydrorhamnose reductase